MKVITSYTNQDYSKALRDLASLLLEDEVDVTTSVLDNGTIQYDFFIDEEQVLIDEEANTYFQEEVSKLRGVVTYIGTGTDSLNDSDTIPGLTRHPNYPIWYSTQDISIPTVYFNNDPSEGYRVISRALSPNSFVSRTQIVISMLMSGHEHDSVLKSGYRHTVVPHTMGFVPDEEEIKLVEAKDYSHALAARATLSQHGVASMIHPSGAHPVVSYIATVPFREIKTDGSGVDKQLGYEHLTPHQIGVHRHDGDDGLKAIHEDYVE